MRMGNYLRQIHNFILILSDETISDNIPLIQINYQLFLFTTFKVKHNHLLLVQLYICGGI